jgi:hypothetical protein
MNRREAISQVGWILGGTIIGSSLFLEFGCSTSPEQKLVFFDQKTVDLLNEIGETILPKTSTPGAKEAQVGLFMDIMVKDCYTKEHQLIFQEGIKTLESELKSKSGKSFMESTTQERTSVLTALDAEQKAYTETKKPEDAPHYFRMMKELTLLGFFTSEVGSTKALRYVETPGKFDGDVPYKKGDRAWANA